MVIHVLLVNSRLGLTKFRLLLLHVLCRGKLKHQLFRQIHCPVPFQAGMSYPKAISVSCLGLEYISSYNAIHNICNVLRSCFAPGCKQWSSIGFLLHFLH